MTNREAAWFYDSTTGIKLVAREGEPAPGTPPGTNFFSVGVRINDARQLAFMARLTDGSSGIFLTAVPEPGPASLLAVGFAVLMLTTRKRSR